MLIQCSECKHKVSEEASKCPNCGHLLAKGKSRQAGYMATGMMVLGWFPVLYHALGNPLPENWYVWFMFWLCCSAGVSLYDRYKNRDQKK